jgi:hypothetical protein
MLLFVLSRVTGLLREVIIADQFGAGADLDAYLAAFRVPDILFQLVAGGALGSAFIPTFAQSWAQTGAAASWLLFSRALNLVERSLQPVDQAVERIDQRAFGLLTASVVVLDSDIRERMDDVYKVLDSRVLRTPALKLAFAGAACERLQAGSQQDRPSLLSPIIPDVFRWYMPEGGAGPAAGRNESRRLPA